MSVRQPQVISAPVALRLSGLVMVLAGLFGMHGLTSPDMDMDMGMAMGTAPSAAMGASDMGVAATGVALTGTGPQVLAGPLAGQAHQMTETMSLSGSGSGPGGMAMKIAMMCLAVLGAALIAVLRFLRRRRAAPVVWSLPRHRPRPVRYRGRDPDPPSLIKLSVQRC